MCTHYSIVKIDTVSTPRVLTRTLLHSGRIHTMMLVELADGNLKISPFEFETANTVLIDGVTLLLNKNATPTIIKKLEQHISMIPLDGHFLHATCNAIATADLFSPSESETGNTALYRIARI